jgi:hypothetical protein
MVIPRPSRERLAAAGAMTAVIAAAEILALPGLATGCGLLGNEPARAFPKSGVGDFGPSAPVEVCLGSARVVSSSRASTASAVCVKHGAEGAACASDASCRGAERCICGRCIVQACDSGTSCGDGQVCRGRRCTTGCSADDACTTGERCVTGGCARPCSSDAACAFGERCDPLDNVCGARLCSDEVPCRAAERCTPIEVVGSLREPELVSIGGESLLFLEIRRPAAGGTGEDSAIYRARASTSLRYTIEPAEPVIAAASEGGASAPSALVREGRLELYFTLGEGAGIARAISTDEGRTFRRAPGLVLSPESAWENGWIGSPAAVLRGGEALLFYEGGPRAGIGLARITAGGEGSRLHEAPVLAPTDVEDPLFWRGVTEVSAPYAVMDREALRLYFTARGAEGGDALVDHARVPADRNDSIGLVTTRDLVGFTRSPTGPVFARSANLRAYLGEREAAVRLGGVSATGLRDAEIVFVAADAAGSAESGLAHAGGE